MGYMGIFNFLLNTVDAMQNLANTTSKINDMGDEIRSLLTGDSVTPDDFLKFYNLRSYDFHNKCNDIKFVKTIDFDGAYILHNHTKRKYYVGVSTRVFRKVERIFKGFEKKKIYEEWTGGNQFTIQLVKLEHTDCDTIDELYRNLRNQHLEDKDYIFI